MTACQLTAVTADHTQINVPSFIWPALTPLREKPVKLISSDRMRHVEVWWYEQIKTGLNSSWGERAKTLHGSLAVREASSELMQCSKEQHVCMCCTDLYSAQFTWIIRRGQLLWKSSKHMLIGPILTSSFLADAYVIFIVSLPGALHLLLNIKTTV